MINIQEKMVSIFKTTCGSWQNCNESTVLSFLAECRDQSIDPQYSFNWLEEHKEQMTNWPNLSSSAQDWVNQHTSSGSPISMNKMDE
jgi:hypothetical protein